MYVRMCITLYWDQKLRRFISTPLPALPLPKKNND